MSCLKKALLLGAMVLVGMLGAGTTVAWVPMNYCDYGMRNVNLHVVGGSLTFQLEQHGSRQLDDGSDLAALRAAFARINAIPTSDASAIDGGTFDLGPWPVDAEDAAWPLDKLNEIYFFTEDTDDSFQAIASAFVYFEPISGTIFGCDIPFDGFRVNWSTATPANPNQPLGTNTYDIGAVAIQEMQHCYGIDHSPIAGRFDPSTGLQVSGFVNHDFSLQSSMFPYPTHTISGRTLRPDDVAAFSTLYPNDHAATSFGQISGKVLRPDGSAVRGAHVVAVPASDPNRPLVGRLSGTDPDVDPGGYRLSGLPPGNYFVRIEPLVGTTNPYTEFNSAFIGLDTSFPPEFYSGASESAVDVAIGSDDAAEIEVAAGAEASGIDFIVNTPGVGPAMSYMPGRLAFVGVEKGQNPSPQAILLRNIGSGTDDWGIGEKPPWLAVSPPSGDLKAEGSPISVSADTSKLAPGTYRGKLMFYARQAANSPQVVSVVLVVIAKSAHIRSVCPHGCSYSSIQAAINASASGDTVSVGPGHYLENIVMKDGVKLVGAGAERSIIDAGGNGITVICASNSLLDGFTITGGNNTIQDYSDEGAGIQCIRARNVEISHNLIANNQIPEQGSYGAGLDIKQSSVAVLDNVFRGNVNGYFDLFSTMGGDGGAIRILNYSELDLEPFDVTVARNRMIDNVAGVGGGLSVYVNGEHRVFITDNLIARNMVTSLEFPGPTGAGIDLIFSTPAVVIITNNTVVDNSNGFLGGNVAGINAFGEQSPVIPITNTIVWGHLVDCGDTTCGAEISDSSGMFDVSYSIVQGGHDGTANKSSDPLFRDRLRRDYRLTLGSPAIDAGTNAAPNIGATDLAGVPRIVDGNGDRSAVADVGAFEFPPRPAGPRLVFSPLRLVFAPQFIFTTSKPQMAALFNLGDLSAHLTALATTGDFGETDNCGSAVVAGTNCNVMVTFRPTLLGPRKGELGAVTDAPVARNVQLQGFGTSTPPPMH